MKLTKLQAKLLKEALDFHAEGVTEHNDGNHLIGVSEHEGRDIALNQLGLPGYDELAAYVEDLDFDIDHPPEPAKLVEGLE